MLSRRDLFAASAALALPAMGRARDDAKFPPGWLPVNALDDKTPWGDVEKIDDKVHVYFPRGDKPVRGAYLSVVFHSADPRELARLWDFALVTIPWPLLWDVGLPDKRSPRPKATNLPMGDMGVLLSFLEAAGRATKHPELATAPLVGWMMQGGNHHAADLMKRAPERVIAWGDSFANQLAKEKDTYSKLPFALAWETNAKKDGDRKKEYAAKHPALAEKLTPAPDFRCEATTYGFPHGVYSKWNFFQAYMDRCIRARLPDAPPEPGKPVKLKPVSLDAGWCADFADVSEWVPIAPSKGAKGMVSPQWLPDEYAAWVYRAYHTANPDLKVTSPVREYARGNKKGCGLGYGEAVKAGAPLALAAEGKGEYAKVEFRSGDAVLAVCEKAPWKAEGVKLARGLHALIAVGVRADGTRTSSRPAFLTVE
jgi:hypothetical protein